MSIIRSPRPERYTLLDNVVFSSNLSFRAIGLLSYLLSKPAHWEVSIAQLVSFVSDSKKPDGRDTIYSIINELIDAGFVKREISRKEAGKMNGYDYHVFDTPQDKEPCTEEPYPSNPYTAKPCPVKPTQVNTEDPVTTDLEENTEQIGTFVPEAFAKSKQADDVREVFEHWQTVMDKKRSKLDDARRRLIQRAMKGGYSTDDLKRAIDGCRASPFHMGDNTQRTKYNGLDLILRNSEKIDQFMERAGAGRVKSAHTGFTASDYQGLDHVSEAAREWLGDRDA